MGQQFELHLADEPEVTLALRPPPRRRLPAVIDLMPLRAAKPVPQKAAPAIVPPDASAEDAFRLTLTQCRWHIAANMRAVAEARDIEGMHQMRVAFRRLRVAFAAFGPEFRTPALERLRERAKRLAARLAPARDLDVFLTELFEPAASANGSKEAFAVLRARAEAQRKTAWDNALAQITGHALNGYLDDLGDAIDRCQWYEGPDGRARPAKGFVAFEQPAGALAARMVERRFKHARKRARHIKALDENERHHLRIALKKLRYTSEFFAPFFAQDSLQGFQKRLSKMQDILGALNDVAVARKTLDHLVNVADGDGAALHGELSFAAGIVYGWHLERSARTWEDAKTRWRKLARAEPFWEDAHGA